MTTRICAFSKTRSNHRSKISSGPWSSWPHRTGVGCGAQRPAQARPASC
jgi:hypothetical protein